MRILLVHNAYGSENPSGENEMVRIEQQLLLDNGHDVELFSRNSDDIRAKGWVGAVQGALAVPWNPFEARRFKAAAARFQPDVVHAHNTFPLISAAIYSAAPAHAARVLTMHNYRLYCAAAIPMLNGRVCTDCIDQRSVLPGLKAGCYRQSRLATLPLAAGIALHRARGTWSTDVDGFIALTEFQRQVMVSGGLPAEATHVKPNFFPGDPAPVSWPDRKPSCVFAGRLTTEKGVTNLIQAWRAWGPGAPPLRIIGSGPLRDSMESLAAGLNVSFLGQLPAESTYREIAEASLLIVPSQCFEGFPLVLREAFAHGTPVAVSNIGPLPALARQGQCGLIFDGFDATSLMETVRAAWADPARLKALSAAGRQEFLSHYTAEANHNILMTIYDAATARRKEPNRGHA